MRSAAEVRKRLTVRIGISKAEVALTARENRQLHEANGKLLAEVARLERLLADSEAARKELREWAGADEAGRLRAEHKMLDMEKRLKEAVDARERVLTELVRALLK